MNKPRHGRSDVGHLPADIHALLDAERALPPPPPAAESRIRARVAGTLAAAGGVGIAGSATATAATAAGTTSAVGVTGAVAKVGGTLGAMMTALSVKTSLFIIVAAAGTTGGLALHHRARVARTTTATTSALRERRPAATIVVAPVAPVLPVAPVSPPGKPIAVVERRPIETRVVVPPERAPTVTTPVEISEENALLATALAALAHDAPAQALDALGAHAHRFPHGQLEEEREALWIRALVARGDADAARARAAQFRAHFPTSIQNQMVSTALATIPR